MAFTFFPFPSPHVHSSYATIKPKDYWMARKKIDGVIEAVRYTPGGKISVVRTYERRGAVWSDYVILDRTELIARMSAGRIFVTGQRKASLGSVFQTGSAVHISGEHILSGAETAPRDLLVGVSIF
jgi:hypothetical protein